MLTKEGGQARLHGSQPAPDCGCGCGQVVGWWQAAAQCLPSCQLSQLPRKAAAAIITAPAPAQQLLTHPADQAAPHTALPQHHSPFTSPRFWRSPIFRLNRSLIIISISMFATLSTQYIMRIKLLLFSLMALFLSQTAAVKLSNGPRNKKYRHKIFLHVLPYVSQRHLCNISWKKCV